MVEKKSACVVDHSFHMKTRSFDFIREFLQKEYDLENYWDYSMDGGERPSIDVINNYQTVFFFQKILPIESLKKIKAAIVWIPMYDAMRFDDVYWYKLSCIPIKIVCFCKVVYEHVSRFGIDAVYVKHYKNPEEYPQVDDYAIKRVFFWHRGNVSLESVKKVLDGNKIDSFDILQAADPNYDEVVIDEESRKKYNICLHADFLSREEYLSIVARNNIFISPRLKEGMGMAFLEAIAMGHCIIANADATMNEYIQHGKNGFLFDANNPAKIDLTHFEGLAQQSRKDCEKGWDNWNRDIERIISFLNTEHYKCRKESIVFCVTAWLRLKSKFKRYLHKALNIVRRQL